MPCLKKNQLVLGSWSQCMRKKPERGLSMIQRNCQENSCSICYTNLSRLVHSPNARPQGREGFPWTWRWGASVPCAPFVQCQTAARTEWRALPVQCMRESGRGLYMNRRLVLVIVLVLVLDSRAGLRGRGRAGGRSGSWAQCMRKIPERGLSMNRRFGVPALAGPGRLKAGHQTSFAAQSGSWSPSAGQKVRGGFPWTVRLPNRNRLSKAALKTHALQTLSRGPLTRPARSVWSASDLSALLVPRSDCAVHGPYAGP